jgi:hypothetical protein
MANLRRRIPRKTESLFAENHEPFFNSIGHERRFEHFARRGLFTPITEVGLTLPSDVDANRVVFALQQFLRCTPSSATHRAGVTEARTRYDFAPELATVLHAPVDLKVNESD